MFIGRHEWRMSLISRRLLALSRSFDRVNLVNTGHRPKKFNHATNQVCDAIHAIRATLNHKYQDDWSSRPLLNIATVSYSPAADEVKYSLIRGGKGLHSAPKYNLSFVGRCSESVQIIQRPITWFTIIENHSIKATFFNIVPESQSER
jgi:hypothetical protein